MRHSFRLLLVLICAWVATPSNANPQKYEHAKRITTEPFKPSYGMDRNAAEGWLYYTYNVDVDGSVRDVEIIDSSGASHLNSAFLRYLQAQKFEPAKLDGKPVMETIGPAPFLMLYDMERGVSRRFRSIFFQGRKQLRAGNILKAEEALARLEDEEGRNMYEEVHLLLLAAMLYRESGEQLEELYHLSRVLDFERDDLKHQYLDDEQLIGVLVRFYQIEMENMRIADARESADWLIEIDSDHPAVQQVKQHSEQVKAQLSDAAEFRMRGELFKTPNGDTGRWTAALLRRNIMLDNVNGDVTKVVFQCDDGQLEPEHAISNIWTLPESWGDCRIFLEGNSGTTFEVVELPVTG